MKSWLLLLLSISFYALNAQSDNYTVDIKHFMTDKGLSSNMVYDIHKDSRGLIWVATNGGLNRFDGEQFYKTPVKNLQNVHQILEDDEGYLWIIEGHEINVNKVEKIVFWNIQENRIVSFEERFAQKLPFEPKDITYISQLENGKIILNTLNSQVFIFSTKNNLQQISIKTSLSIFLQAAIIDDKIWLFATDSTYNKVYWILSDFDGNVLQKKEIEKGGKWRFIGKWNNKELLYLYRQNDGHFLIYAFDDKGNIDIFDKTKLLPNQHIPKIIAWQDYIKIHPNQDICFVAFSGTFQIINLNTQEIIYASKDNTGIANQYWRNPFFEKGNNGWIPTSKGIFLFRWQQNNFKKILHDGDFKPSTREIWIDDNSLIVNSYKGSFIVDLKNENKYEKLPFINELAISFIKKTKKDCFGLELQLNLFYGINQIMRSNAFLYHSKKFLFLFSQSLK